MGQKLTPKQVRFVSEYLKDLNATQASIRAGYSARTAEQQGPRLLGNVGVAAAITAGKTKAAERNQLSVDYVLTRLQAVAERCMQAEPVLDKEGNETGEYRFEAAGANRSLELLGKHLGMFADRLLIGDLGDKSDEELNAELIQLRQRRAGGHDQGNPDPAGT